MTDAGRPLVQLLRSTELAGTAPCAYAATVSPGARLIFTAGACPLDQQGRTVAVRVTVLGSPDQLVEVEAVAAVQ